MGDVAFAGVGFVNGGYSVDVSNVEEGTGEMLVDKFMEMLHKLNPGN